MRYYKDFLLDQRGDILCAPHSWQLDRYIVLQTAPNGLQVFKGRAPRGAKRSGGGKYR